MIRYAALQMPYHSSQFPPYPWGAWSAFTFIAIVGSLVYGASLSLVFPSFQMTQGAFLVLLSAGFGWFVFGPLLVVISKIRVSLCAHACMIAMVYGELILFFGSLINLFLFFFSFSGALLFNAIILIFANLAMCYILMMQLATLHVSKKNVLITWVFGLNISGIAFFYIFKNILF